MGRMGKGNKKKTKQILRYMTTLLILLVICGISVVVHKLMNFDPCEKIELRRYFINKASENIAYAVGLLMLVIIIINLIEAL